MLDTSMEPEFPKDCIIVIEPSKVCASGAFVLINVAGEHWFRQFVKNEQDDARLVAVNADFPDIPLGDNDYQIEGVIVQRNVKRKIKHYKPYQPNNGVALKENVHG